MTLSFRKHRHMHQPEPRNTQQLFLKMLLQLRSFRFRIMPVVSCALLVVAHPFALCEFVVLLCEREGLWLHHFA